MANLLEYKDDHRLAYVERGDPNGYPVLIQHGMIASIRDDRLFDRFVGMGVRLILVARPGYGASSPYVLRDLAEWGEIVALLVNALGLGQLDVLGISSGAPYSYAVGYKLPGKVRTIYILSGTPALYDARIQALWPYPIDQDASLPELQALARTLFFSDLSQEALVRNDVRDSMANDCFGVAQDLKLRCADWGFRLGEVRSRVIMQHSRFDEQVPFVTAERTAGLLPNCRFVTRERGGHFSREILDGFIAGEMVGCSVDRAQVREEGRG
jgi:pimeloyl-ACP methyl ester carboxylesterase